MEAWFSHLCFAELVVEVRHCGGDTLQGVVVRRVAACTFLGDGVGGDGWSGENGDHRGQSKDHGDCGGEDQSSRWDLNRCHSHTLRVLDDVCLGALRHPGFKGRSGSSTKRD